MALSPYYIKRLQFFVAFLFGNQLVHYFMNPLGNVGKIAEEKKSKLWAEYLATANKSGISNP